MSAPHHDPATVEDERDALIARLLWDTLDVLDKTRAVLDTQARSLRAVLSPTGDKE